MKKNFLEAFKACSIGLAISITSSLIEPAEAQGRKEFHCDLNSSVPITKSIEDGTPRNLIRWVSTYWSDKGYTPEKRCIEVTGRISAIYQREGSFRLGVGTINRIPVICVTEREPGYGQVYPCRPDGLIVTLAPGEDGNQVMRQFEENWDPRSGLSNGVERPISSTDPLIIE